MNMIILLIMILCLPAVILKLYIPAVILLSAAIIIQLFSGRREIKKKIVKYDSGKDYVLSYRALADRNLIHLIKSGIISGKFIVSIEMMINIRDSNDDTTESNTARESLDFLKRNDLIKPENIKPNITSLFKYAFDNSCIMIISGEKGATGISGIFNVKFINLDNIRISKSEKHSAGSRVDFIVTDADGDVFEGFVVNKDVKTFTKSDRLVTGRIYSGIVKNVLDIKGKLKLIIGTDNED